MSDRKFFGEIAEKLESGSRLDFEDGVRLYESRDILGLGELADRVRRRMHGRRVYYAVNAHLNYTNVCSLQCPLCAFSRTPRDPDAYQRSVEECAAHVAHALKDWGVDEVHIVGGLNPGVGLDYCESLVKRVRSLEEALFIKAFAAPEIDFIAKQAGLSWEETLRTLKAAGLNGLPGGGAEIFSPEIRRKICPNKISGDDWLAIHRTAHGLGLVSNATMLYGHVETHADRVRHGLELRRLQDETGGFRAFVPLAFRPEHASLKRETGRDGLLDIKVFAVSRLLLDNIPHLKAHGASTGIKLGQALLSFGADDFGGTNYGETILREAGAPAGCEMDPPAIESLIRDAGFEPYRVASAYVPV